MGMPYVTEQLWSHIMKYRENNNKNRQALMLSDWPQMNDDTDLVTCSQAVKSFEHFQELIRCIRNVRAEYNIRPNKMISTIIIAEQSFCQLLYAELQCLVTLARLNPANVLIYDEGSEVTKN